jgi:hypothetical protein
LFGKILRFGAPHGESAYQTGKVVERDFVGEQDAGEAGSGQQLCETAFGLPRFERNAIEQKLVVRNSEQEAGVAAFRQSLLEFLPSGFELTFGALVIYSVEASVLDENIEAMQERARRRATAGIGLGNGIDNSLLSRREIFLNRLSGKVT